MDQVILYLIDKTHIFQVNVNISSLIKRITRY